MSDRLEEIKVLYSVSPESSWPEIPWLIAEVEQSRLVGDILVASIVEAAQWNRSSGVTLTAHIVALRGALQALVDATAYDESLTFSEVWAKHDAARAAAVALLAGPGGET